MALNPELVSQLVKITNDRGRDNQNYTVYGTVTNDGNRNYVKMDGSELSTPIETTVEINEGDRVIVEVKNHTATVTGNTSNPAIGVKTAGELRSEISQTAGEIRLEVANTASGLESKITQNADNITSVVKNQNEFSEFKQTVEGFSFMNKGGTVKIGNGDIDLTGAIKFSDLADSESVQDQINTANDNASDALDVADGVLTTVNGITIKEGSKTYLDGEMLYTNSVYADAIHLGGALTVYKTLYGNTVGGYLGFDDGFSSTEGIGIRAADEMAQVVCTENGARLSYGSLSQVFVDDYSVNIDGDTAIAFKLGGSSFLRMADDYFAPYTNGYAKKLGHSATPWDTVYASTSTIQTSDRNKKNSIEDLPSKYLTLFDGLRPRIFKMNDGTSDRYHVGYIAQEVEEAMNAAGIDSQEFAGFIRAKDEDGNDILMLRYGEFDAIYSAKIKQQDKEILALKADNENLKTRLEKLEALLLTENT